MSTILIDSHVVYFQHFYLYKLKTKTEPKQNKLCLAQIKIKQLRNCTFLFAFAVFTQKDSQKSLVLICLYCIELKLLLAPGTRKMVTELQSSTNTNNDNDEVWSLLSTPQPLCTASTRSSS